MCDVLVDSSLHVAEETSPVLVGSSTVIVASGSAHVAAQDLVAPLHLRWAVLPLNHCRMWGILSGCGMQVPF